MNRVHTFVATTCIAFMASGCLGLVGGDGGGGSPDLGSSGVGGGNGGSGGTGGGGAMPDMAPTGDMTDVTPIPAPMAKHVGATGPTAGLVTDGNQHAAYLLNPTVTPSPRGELHVTDAAGTDVKVAATAYLGGYMLAPDGKSLIFTQLTAGAMSASLSWLDLSTPNATPKTVLASGIPVQALDAQGTQLIPAPLGQLSFFSPSAKFALVGTQTLARSLDFHVVDLHAGNDVYTRGNGAFDYLELVLPDDTMIFQDTAGGTTPNTPPVQTLYWVPLGKAGATATAITSRTAQFRPTVDNKTLVILKTNGDVLTWDLTAKTGAGTKIASGVAVMALGTQPNGPLAYIGADKSVHVLTLDGRKLLDLTGAQAGADVTGTITLASDAGDVYWFQAVDTQNNRGTLLHATVGGAGTVNQIATNISFRDLNVVDGAIVVLQNVDALGQFGDAARAKRDGSGLTPLGTKVNVGGLAVVNPGPNTWFALHLTNGALSATNAPIDGSLPLSGALAWDDYAGGNEVTLDPAAHFGTFGFSDDGRDVVFVSGATYNATAMNYEGALKFLATRAPSMTIDGTVAGVSEVGPILSRSLFVNAPGATPAGIYFVKY